MVIKYQIKKNTMRIFSDAKVLPSNFRKYFLSQLVENFNLYGYIDNKITLLNNKVIEESVNLSELEIAEYRELYELEKIDISFDEFLDWFKVAFGEIYLYNADVLVSSNFKRNEELLAIIILEPDGDLDCICIGIFASEIKQQMINIIEKFNS